jgi:hypothetical protein
MDLLENLLVVVAITVILCIYLAITPLVATAFMT